MIRKYPCLPSILTQAVRSAELLSWELWVLWCSAHLYLQDDADDVEMTYECKKADTLAGSGVGQGATFIIVMDDDDDE